MKSRLFLLFGFAVLVGLGVTVGAAALSRPYTYAGSLIDPPVKAADFTLTRPDGQPFQLSRQQGKAVLIFFGYTHCPDVCPVTLSKFKQLRAALGDQAGGVEFVFITVDPERDTPAVIGAHVANYDPAIIGLSGTRAQLEPVWKGYGVYQAQVQTGSADGYAVDHTTRIYVIDPQGNWRLTFPFEMETEAMLADVQHVLEGSGQ